MGFSFALDDLGSGYSSLEVLAELAPRFIKIDRSIVSMVHLDPRRRRLVELLQSFAAASDSGLIAEGVESREVADCLLECGVELMQGFLFGEPSLVSPFAPRTDG